MSMQLYHSFLKKKCKDCNRKCPIKGQFIFCNANIWWYKWVYVILYSKECEDFKKIDDYLS